MDLTTVIRQLRAVGATVTISERAGVDLVVDGDPVEVKVYHRDPTPSDIQGILARTPGTALVKTSRVTPALTDLTKRHLNLIVVSDSEIVRGGEKVIWVEWKTPPPVKRGPRPYGKFAVGRAMLAGRNVTQQSLASRAGVSQGAVSQYGGGWRAVADDRELFDRLVADYPGPGGTETFWWSDRPLREQAEDLRAAGALISGDIAASAIRGWRVPEHVVAYSLHQINLAAKGYVLASADDHTTRVVVPKDRTLWATSAAFGREGIADPVISAYDVLRTGTTGDQEDAARVIREATVHA